MKSAETIRSLACRLWLIFRSAADGFVGNNDLLRAAALTYTVALSAVPILALAFSALKGMGEAEQMRGLIERYLAMGSSGAGGQLMGYVENVNSAALGSAGAAFLLITVISTMSNIEQAFNAIFGVRRSRTYLRRFTDYLSVLFTVPLLMAAALTLTTVSSIYLFHTPAAAGLIPYLLAWAGFLFLFVFFPYTQVRYGPALFGSFVTAVLFQLGQWGYVKFQVGVAGYRAIYGALATVPVFLVWIYLAWAIVLFGAEVTAAAQRGAYRTGLRPVSPEFPFAAALHLLLRLAQCQAGRGEAPGAGAFASELGVTETAIAPVLERLEDAGLVIETAAGAGRRQPLLFLVRVPSSIKLVDVFELAMPDGSIEQRDPNVTELIRGLNQARRQTLQSLTLEDLLAKTDRKEIAAGSNP